jgi:hypothetical protein
MPCYYVAETVQVLQVFLAYFLTFGLINCNMKRLIFIDDNPPDHFILKRILNKYQLAYEVS